MPEPTMHALILNRPGSLSYEIAPIPEPQGGDILVRVKAATTCGTDLKAFLRGHPQIPMPGVFGHEYSGVVEAAGPGSHWKPGTPVMGVHSAPCQQCFWCKHDQENLCESIMSSKVLGSFADYLLVPSRIADLNVYEKPDSLSFECASLLEPLSCVAQGIKELLRSTALDKASRILVLGPGAIGLMFVAALRHMGFENLTLGGRSKERLGIGSQLGAKTFTWDDLETETGDGFDAVIECIGIVAIWQKSIDFVRRGGTLMLFGGCPSGTEVCFDTKRLHYDQITLLSPFHFGTESVKTARKWLLDKSMDLSSLITGSRVLTDGAKVFEDLKNGVGIKYVFNP